MTELQFIQFAIDIWGVLFCLLALICIYFTRHFDKKGAAKLSLALICCLLMLLADAAGLWSYIGPGDPLISERASTDLVYLFEFLILYTSVNYVSYIILKRSGRDFNVWRMVEFGISLIGIALIGINIGQPFMYTSDSLGYYMKLDLYMLPNLLLITGIILAIGVIIDNRKYLRKVEKIAMISYMLFPALAELLQIYVPDMMMGSFAITVSTIIMFVAYEFNYTRFYIDVERRSNENRMKLISAQIHPHFVFNSLSMIRYLSVHEPEETPRAINEFSAFLRGCTDLIDEDRCIPASEEFELVRHYIYLQQKRFGDELRVEFDIKDEGFELPAFSVQTAVENAITHGLLAREDKEGSLITIKSHKHKDKHHVVVEDNGVGFDIEKIDLDEGSHSGINATRQRLAMMCGGKYSIKSEPGSGTVVTIVVPDEKQKASGGMGDPAADTGVDTTDPAAGDPAATAATADTTEQAAAPASTGDAPAAAASTNDAPATAADAEEDAPATAAAAEEDA